MWAAEIVGGLPSWDRDEGDTKDGQRVRVGQGSGKGK